MCRVPNFRTKELGINSRFGFVMDGIGFPAPNHWFTDYFLLGDGDIVPLRNKEKEIRWPLS